MKTVTTRALNFDKDSNSDNLFIKSTTREPFDRFETEVTQKFIKWERQYECVQIEFKLLL